MRALLSAVVVAVSAAALVAACGDGSSELPRGVPTVPAPLPPDGGPLVDGGEAFLAACEQLACPVERCEAFADGGFACGHLCGNSCGAHCASSRCAPPDGGSFQPAWCTNFGDGGYTWQPNEDRCDDNNDCTSNDLCDATQGKCIGTNAAVGVGCDDGSPCTGNDQCDGQGQCVGTKSTISPIDIYLRTISPFNYAYSTPNDVSFTQYSFQDEHTILQSNASGDLPIYRLKNPSTTLYDRVLSPTTSEAGGYTVDGNSAPIAHGFSSHLKGTKKLLRFKLPANTTHCGGGQVCHVFTANPNDPLVESGATQEDSGLWVCPP